ncbi:hypothetical protein [Reticulibacter mediterranei]|nr:hypothetical protein [Reticulibacter mediterranei]
MPGSSELRGNRPGRREVATLDVAQQGTKRGIEDSGDLRDHDGKRAKNLGGMDIKSLASELAKSTSEAKAAHEAGNANAKELIEYAESVKNALMDAKAYQKRSFGAETRVLTKQFIEATHAAKSAFNAKSEKAEKLIEDAEKARESLVAAKLDKAHRIMDVAIKGANRGKDAETHDLLNKARKELKDLKILEEE